MRPHVIYIAFREHTPSKNCIPLCRISVAVQVTRQMCQLVNLIFELTIPPVMMATLQVHSIHLHQSKSVHVLAKFRNCSVRVQWCGHSATPETNHDVLTRCRPYFFPLSLYPLANTDQWQTAHAYSL